MNQKGLTNIIVIGIAVAILLGVVGYFVLVKQPPSGTKSVTKIPSSPTKLGGPGDPAAPVDQVLAEITILSQTEDEWKIRVDKTRDYIRYPRATNPQLKAGDTISARFNGWENTVQYIDKMCPDGYLKSPKPEQGELETQPAPIPPQPIITVGKQYLATLYGCFAEIGGLACPNQKSGWSGRLYNPYPTVIEYECVKPEPNIPPPPVEPQR